MKSSSILQAVLHKYKAAHNLRQLTEYPGICDNITVKVQSLVGHNRKATKDLFGVVFKYIKKYEPEQHGLYWWPENDVETRIQVLEWAIRDALEQGD